MNRTDIPRDSLLHEWVTYLSATEIPFSYQVAAGLSVLGACLKRQRWVDQMEWRVYPNQSVLFIGPSGVGKDTVINRCQKVMESMHPYTRVPVLGGKTKEAIDAQLAMLPKPAAAFIPAGELTAFFGKAEYQANLLTGMTDLLSGGEKVDITTKGSMALREGKSTCIYQPTLTMHGGSTVEWLHKNMPDGTMEGGFLGRFLIIVEELGGKHVPLVKSAYSKDEIAALRDTLQRWMTGLERLIKIVAEPREVIVFEDADYFYTNWYHNRFRYFSRAVMPYANRSRDMFLRLAMLMAFSRGHDRHIELCDVEFAKKVIGTVAANIDRVVLPPTDEAKCAAKIEEMLPAMTSEIYAALAVRYQVRLIESSLNLLVASGRASFDRQKGLYIAKSKN